MLNLCCVVVHRLLYSSVSALPLTLNKPIQPPPYNSMSNSAERVALKAKLLAEMERARAEMEEMERAEEEERKRVEEEKRVAEEKRRAEEEKRRVAVEERVRREEEERRR